MFCFALLNNVHFYDKSNNLILDGGTHCLYMPLCFCLCVCVRVCVCVYVLSATNHAYMHMHAHTNTHTQTRTHTPTHTLARARARAHTHTHMHTHPLPCSSLEFEPRSTRYFSVELTFFQTNIIGSSEVPVRSDGVRCGPVESGAVR